jgi:hypothetical protein
MRLDQESEMTGVRKMTTGGEGSAMVMTTMRMFSRAIVEGASEEGTTVLAVTDSIITTSTDEKTRAATLQSQSKLRGQRVRFRVSPDGMVAMLQDAGPAPREVAQVVSLMPTTFPKGAINIGESWMRDMALPVGNGLGAQVAGRLHVTFRLDSVTRAGDLAFVSMRGEMQPASGPGAASDAVLEKGPRERHDGHRSEARMAGRVLVQHRHEFGDVASTIDRRAFDADANAHHPAHAHARQALSLLSF